MRLVAPLTDHVRVALWPEVMLVGLATNAEMLGAVGVGIDVDDDPPPPPQEMLDNNANAWTTRSTLIKRMITSIYMNI